MGRLCSNARDHFMVGFAMLRDQAILWGRVGLAFARTPRQWITRSIQARLPTMIPRKYFDMRARGGRKD